MRANSRTASSMSRFMCISVLLSTPPTFLVMFKQNLCNASDKLGERIPFLEMISIQDLVRVGDETA